MPGKSRHRKGKYSFQAAKRGGPDQSHQPARQAGAVPAAEGVSSQLAQVSPKSAAPSPPESAVVHHPFIAAELRTIGILAVLMAVILVVLALTLA